MKLSEFPQPVFQIERSILKACFIIALNPENPMIYYFFSSPLFISLLPN